jgi:hypothetical protein
LNEFKIKIYKVVRILAYSVDMHANDWTLPHHHLHFPPSKEKGSAIEYVFSFFSRGTWEQKFEKHENYKIYFLLRTNNR